MNIMKCEIDKEQAAKAYNARLPIIIPSAIVGFFGGLGFGVFYLAPDLSYFHVITFAFPLTTGLGLGGILLGRWIGMQNELGTIELDENTIQRTFEKDNETVSLERERIEAVKDDPFGIRVKGEGKTIVIPKGIDQYEAFRKELKTP